MIVTQEGFLRVPVTRDMTDRAQAKAAVLGRLNNSIRAGEGNLCGFLGEEVVLAALPGSISKNTFQWDIQWEELTFEVKSKDRTVPPRRDHEGSIALYNTQQGAKVLIFVSLLRCNPNPIELACASALIGGDTDALQSSRQRLSRLLADLRSPAHERAREMLWTYRITCKNDPNRLMRDLIAAVTHNHPKTADQREMLTLFGIDPRFAETHTAGYVCGFIPKEEFGTRARLWNVGDVDALNGWACKAACLNMEYGDLDQFGYGANRAA